MKLLANFDNGVLNAERKATLSVARIFRTGTFIERMEPDFTSDVFENPKDDSFATSVNQVYQTIGGADCYPIYR